MEKLVKFVEKKIHLIGEWSSYLNVILVFLICLDVLQRYLLNQTFNWVIELEWHIFGLIFLLGAAYTLQNDKHVRVDLFYHKFSLKTKAIINTLGHALLSIPFCVVAIRTCYNYAANSFYIREGSPNPGGLPALYIIKYVVVFAFILLLLQCLISIFQNIKTIRK